MKCILARALCISLLAGGPAWGAQVVINEIMYHPPPGIPENPSFEWVELYNTGTNAVNLTGWRFSKGVDFNFPSNTMLAAGGYLVVAADIDSFQSLYPGVANVVGGWSGTLANGGEEIELEEPGGVNHDSVTYADEGDWGIRRILPDPNVGLPSWEWTGQHDGLGSSLELINPHLSNNSGQNWAASLTPNGTPGQANSVLSANIAPMILDVRHFPIVPTPLDPVTITARILDEQTNGIFVTLFYRIHSTLSPDEYNSLVMFDDGAHNDGASGDGVYGAVAPALPNGTVIEFYVQATDGVLTRTWPAPTLDQNGFPEQGANALYQVDDSVYGGPQPLIRIIMTETERSRLQSINRQSDAQMNATFITAEGTDIKLRYNVGVRIRGAGSRGDPIPNYRVNIPKDRLWNGVSEVNLNQHWAYNQVVGSAVLQKSGLVAADARGVQVRVNGANLAGNAVRYSYGSYALLEVINGDWADHHLPNDSAGNIYRGSTGAHTADLRYRGTDPQTYINNGYSKVSNISANDWSDLMLLTSTLTSAPDATYINDIRQVIDVDLWMRYFALFTALTSMETSIANGEGDDFGLYRGTIDTRFIVLPHDLDTIFGQGDTAGNVNASLFRMCSFSRSGVDTIVLDRFMTNATFVRIYYKELNCLLATTFSSAQLDPLLDQLLTGWMPPQNISAMKQFAAARNVYIRSQIPTALSINTSLPIVSGYPQTTSSTISLNGRANPVETYSVRVNGAPAAFEPWLTTWSISAVTLNPGLNRVLVQALGESGAEIERAYLDVWYDRGVVTDAPAAIVTDTVWTAANGPYRISGNVGMNSGVSLTIEPGTTVYFAPNASLLVGGTLLAAGTDTQRIRFTREPGIGGAWFGIAFEDSQGSNHIAYADIEFAGIGDSIALQNSSLLVDHVTWSGTTRTIIDLANSSLIVRNSVFPTIVDNETIHGVGMPANGYVIIESNYFGGTTGYSDIIDFTGGKRPGPIIQILDNVFNGGSDDVLDLDGTDAHIEGNVFMSIRQDAARDSTSNAIATDAGSEVTVVRNIFYNLEHALLLKNGASAVFDNNTVYQIGSGPASSVPSAVINFGEPNRGVGGGAGAVLDGNVFWGIESNRLFLNFTNAVMSLVVNHSILPGTNAPGNGNLDLDPHFVNDATNFITHLNIRQALALLPGSPGVGTGPNGLDMGALVPGGASISGEPPSPTPLTSATLTVAGPGITDYRYSLNGGAFGPETTIATPIQLSGLASGSYTVRVIGKNSAAVWQAESNATVSRTWTVTPSAGGVRLNEILARNDSGAPFGGEFPDLVELLNTGATPADLSGMGLTDDPDDPFKFKLPPGTTLGPGAFLLLLADGESTPPGLHLGFGLSLAGDALYLYAANGAMVDSVKFGPQLPDLSVGRLSDGTWGLTRPTFGAANVAHPVGDARRLKINEWLADGGSLFAEDFIELFNPDTLPVALEGFLLSDRPQGAPALHRIAPLSFIQAAGHLAFVADGEPEDGPLHLGFKLAPEQGQIALFTAQTNLIDCIWYGPQTTDISEGRRPSGADTFSFFGPPTQTQPTPGGPNPGAAGIVTVTNIVVPVLTIVTNWSYEASGVGLDGTGWEQPAYDDSAWPVGLAALGVESAFLPVPLSTVFPSYNGFLVPYYFRTRFVLGTELSGFDLNVTTELDDGAVIYLNGVELTRINMPGGPISSSTLPLSTVGDATLQTFRIPASPSTTLVQGENVLAVEVHNNANPDSSDIVWAMALEAVRTETNSSTLSLVINEVMANNLTVTNFDGTNVTDWVELYNAGNNTVNLSGMSLSDDVSNPRRWVFSPGTTIASGSYLIVRFDSGSPASTNSPAAGALNTGFGLGASGDEVYLFDTLARGGALLDGVTFGLQAADFSIGRVPNGTGAWQLTLPTQNSVNIAANLGPISAVKINEWLANPSGNDDDFFELFNPNPQPVDLSGYFLTDNLADPLQHKIAPLSFIGIGEHGFAEFIADGNNGNGPNHVNFGLRAAGEAIGFYTPAAVAIDTITFGAQANGVSEGRFPDGSSAIVRFPGTSSPGRSNLLPLNDIVVSEVLTHTDPPFEDAIELQNLSASSVDVSGWYLTDAKNDPKRFRIPNGTIIPAGGFVVFYEYQFNPDFTGRPPFFSLSSVNGDEVYLYTADALGHLTGYRSGVRFGAQANAVSFGRYATSVGFDFTAMSARTFGADNPVTVVEFRTGTGRPNAYPLVEPIVISEIMYHPPDDGTNDNAVDEFIELQNISASAFSLFDTNYPTNTWRLRDAVDFNFPQNITVPAGGFVIVVGFDPTNTAVVSAFRTKYNISGAVPIYGPWQGKLDNGGENVELYKPDPPQAPGTPNAGFVPYVQADKVKYGDSAPWPTLADGSTANGVGYSLHRRVLSDYGNDPVNWIAASPTPGGAAGAAPLTPPAITSITPPHALPAGSNDTLTVVATGAPVLTYQWHFNGMVIPGATNAGLALTSFQITNAGVYSVIVVNSAGVASASTRVDFRSPPIINRDPQDVAAAAGGTASFSVVASGTPPLAYQWRHNAADLPGATNAFLLVQNVQPINEGQYRVVITNAFGSVTSAVAVLGIFAPPVITSQPQGTNAFVGSTVAFTVDVSGSPPLRYQWRFNGVDIPAATNSMLTLSNVQVGNSGEYRVFVTNTVGTILSAAASLNVTVPPFVTIVATDGSAAEPGADTGLLTITRTGSTLSPLSVGFAVGGSAMPGSDYVALASPVTIPAGSSSATVLVTVLNDALLEGNETVVVTLNGGVDYAVGSPGNATVVIFDDDNQRPSVVLTNPVDGLTITLPATVLLQAAASDSDGSVSKVEFFDNVTNKLGEALSSPYAFAWTNGSTGVHVLTAVATDNLGSTGVSLPVSIILNAPPTVVLTSPANNAQFSAPATITLNANASDPDGTVTSVEFYAGLTLLGSDSTSPYSFTWTNAPLGDYVLTARATDNRGAVGVSTNISISVLIPPPGFADSFGARGLIGGFTNHISGNNSTYTKELGEPRHENRAGTRSAWVSWVAPASGTCTMDTLNSGFDTVLSIYVGDVVSTLFKVAGNDDATPAVLQSRVSFQVAAGTRYEIAVDGYSAGLGGPIEFHLSLPNPFPIITAQPQSFVVDPGANVVFNVGVGGSGPFTYQWRFNGTNLPGATLASLTRNNVQVPDQGLYAVVVSNQSGSVTSAPAALTLRLPPTIVADPETFVADPGGNATFNVTAVGLTPFSYRWRFNGTAIPGATNGSYTLANAQYSDAGLYSVEVSNSLGSATSQAAELMIKPHIVGFSLANGVFVLSVQAMPNRMHAIDVTTNLTEWLPRTTNSSSAVEMQWADPTAGSRPRGIYRLRLVP